MYNKMTALLVAMMVAGEVACQRPPYVSRPITYPGVLPQYTTPEPGLGDRLASDNSSTSSTTTTTALPLPGSIYQQELINRVPEWPKDKQPFWFVNNQQIQNHTGFQGQGGAPGEAVTQTQEEGSSRPQAETQTEVEDQSDLASRFQNKDEDEESGWVKPGPRKPSSGWYTY